jgi:hypothetical protein
MAWTFEYRCSLHVCSDIPVRPGIRRYPQHAARPSGRTKWQVPALSDIVRQQTRENKRTKQRTLNPLARHRRSRTRRRRRATATGTEPRAARLSADGCVPTQRRIELVRHPGREAGTAQVTPIFDPSPSPAPAGEVHARSVAGTRQVHHRSPGTGKAGSGSVRSGSVTGHREPRHPDPVRPAALDEAARRTNPGVGGAFPAEVPARHPAVRIGCARLPPDLATERGPRPGITGDLSGSGRPITGPDGCPCQGSERFGEPLAPLPRQSDPATRPGS